MKRDEHINNTISKNLRTLLDEWAKAHGDKKQNMLAGGLILYMTVENVLRSAVVAVADQLDVERLSEAELLDTLIIKLSEMQAQQKKAASLTAALAIPPPKSAGRKAAS